MICGDEGDDFAAQSIFVSDLAQRSVDIPCTRTARHGSLTCLSSTEHAGLQWLGLEVALRVVSQAKDLLTNCLRHNALSILRPEALREESSRIEAYGSESSTWI